jgi:hypothetical protein
MKTRLLFVFLFAFTFIGTINAQEKDSKKITVTGIVTDYGNKPIKGAFIFVDSLKTKVKTNKKGLYKIKLDANTKLLTAFSLNHGIIDIDYNKQEKVNFIFPENSEAVTQEELTDIGYDFSYNGRYKGADASYDNYRDIFELLKSRFPNVQVRGQTIRILGTGSTINSNDGSIPPILLVNGSQVSSIATIAPIDIKSIVIERTTTSLYGSRGAGGIIKIKLK